MKNFLQSRAGIIGMICLLVASLSSCVKDRNTYIVGPGPNNQPAAYLSVTNASPDSQPLDFFLNNNQVTSYLSYGQGIDYIRAYTGKRLAIFYAHNSSQKILTDTITLNANVYYSLFLANSVSKPDAILLTDSLSKPASGMATIRFVNVSATTPAVDLGIHGGAVLATNKAYKAYSSFVPVAGNTSYTLEVRPTGTSNVLVSLSNITLRSGSVYTVWLHGVAAATDQTRLSVDIQTNAYN
jgi:hypothetical protein